MASKKDRRKTPEFYMQRLMKNKRMYINPADRNRSKEIMDGLTSIIGAMGLKYAMSANKQGLRLLKDQ